MYCDVVVCFFIRLISLASFSKQLVFFLATSITYWDFFAFYASVYFKETIENTLKNKR